MKLGKKEVTLGQILFWVFSYASVQTFLIFEKKSNIHPPNIVFRVLKISIT